MTTHVHFVGSIALDTVQEVFEAVGASLSPFMKRCPDGEVAGRRLWISWQWPLLRAAPFLEVESENALPGLGLCRLRVKQGIRPEQVRFGPLGYAREARTSYQDFCAARERGVLPRSVCFQVCLPTPLAVIATFIADRDVPTVLPAYEQAMVAEVARICAAIPHNDLALQWDVCIEMLQWDGRFHGVPSISNMPEVFGTAFRRICSAVPADVTLGIHLCYGDMDAKHFVEPEDLSKAVGLANLIIENAGHPIQWVHVPVPINRDDDAYFTPLKSLRLPAGSELYLGVVHAADGVQGTVRRMKAARHFVRNFGIATECGMGRVRSPEAVRGILQVHSSAAAASLD